MEEWKAVVGYEDLYEVSNFGKIRNFPRECCSGKKFIDSGAALRERVCLRKNGKNKFTFVHRVVAQAFIPNPFNKPMVDHINHNAADNRSSNLRWATRSENGANARQGRNLPKGVRFHPRYKIPTYQAYSSVKGRFIHLGHFRNAEEAAACVVKFGKKRYGEFYHPGTEIKYET